MRRMQAETKLPAAVLPEKGLGQEPAEKIGEREDTDMKALFMAVGTCRLGRTTRDKDGNIVSQTTASFEPGPEGGSIAVGRLKFIGEGCEMEQDGPADIFADWDAGAYLARALEILQPGREVNVPDFRAVIKAAAEDDNPEFFCEYCRQAGFRDCRYCVVKEIMEELEEAEQ